MSGDVVWDFNEAIYGEECSQIAEALENQGVSDPTLILEILGEHRDAVVGGAWTEAGRTMRAYDFFLVTDRGLERYANYLIKLAYERLLVYALHLRDNIDDEDSKAITVAEMQLGRIKAKIAGIARRFPEDP